MGSFECQELSTMYSYGMARTAVLLLTLRFVTARVHHDSYHRIPDQSLARVLVLVLLRRAVHRLQPHQ